MKKHLTLLSYLLIFSLTFFACKKDTTSLKARLLGRWQLTRLDVSGYTGADSTKNGSTRYNTVDAYIDFKSNEDDQVEIGLPQKGASIGTYSTLLGNELNMSLSDGLNYCTVDNITQNDLKFTAKVYKTAVVKVYYLKR